MTPSAVPACPRTIASSLAAVLAIATFLGAGLGTPAYAGGDVGRPPPGDQRRIIGILDVRTDGVPPEVAETFQHYLEEQLDTGHYWLASRSRVKERMSNSTHWAEGCLVGACVAEVKAQTGAELVVIAALSGSGTSYGYVVTLVRTDTGSVVAQESDRCDVCTVGEVVQTATIATIKLLSAVPDTLPDEGSDRANALRSVASPIRANLQRVERHAFHTGLALTIGGVVVAAASAAAYFAGSKDNYLLGVMGAGGGLAASGVIVLSF